MRWLSVAFAAWLALCGCAAAQSPIGSFPPGMFQNRAAIDAAPAASYQGLGDALSGWTHYESCGFVYDVAHASTSTLLCDLVDSVSGAAVGTLRGTTAGTVDLTAYFTGSVTPAAACAAAGGGACRVSATYNQVTGASFQTNATNSQRPILTFSAQNGLPGMTGTAAANTNLTSAASVTQAQPWHMLGVAKRTTNFTTQQALQGSSGALNSCLSFTSSANTAGFTADGAATITLGSVTDGNFHALQGVADTSPNAVLAVDGTETTGNVGTSAFSSNTSRIMRCSGGVSIDGVLLEAGFRAGAPTGGQRTAVNSNVHSRWAF